jgi:hypothetical protein
MDARCHFAYRPMTVLGTKFVFSSDSRLAI